MNQSNKQETYCGLQAQLASLLSGERDGLANMANMTALLFQNLSDLNWVGFYLLREKELLLGPFQGQVACVRIPLGRGVCGTAAERRETVIVPDVHAFPGHIACDTRSRSEIVVPLLVNARLFGVLDLDSPRTSRFDQDDADGLASLTEIFLNASDLHRVSE